MITRALTPTLVLLVLTAAAGWAQTAAPGEPDPGVRPTRLLDRAEIRISRVSLQPGATRRVHSHDDVKFHIWMPLDGSMQLIIGSQPPVAVAIDKPYFLERNTPHGFKNVGTTTASVLEIFVKDAATKAERSPSDAIDFALWALGRDFR